MYSLLFCASGSSSRRSIFYLERGVMSDIFRYIEESLRFTERPDTTSYNIEYPYWYKMNQFVVPCRYRAVTCLVHSNWNRTGTGTCTGRYSMNTFTVLHHKIQFLYIPDTGTWYLVHPYWYRYPIRPHGPCTFIL